MENVAAYSTGIISLLIFVLIILVQSALVGAAKSKAGLVPGATPKNDYSDRVYRLHRCHQNGVEILAAAAIVLFAGILVGVAPFWVNLLMALFLIFRLIYVYVHVQSVGKPVQSVRTFVYVAGWAMLVVLCVMSILKLL